MRRLRAARHLAVAMFVLALAAQDASAQQLSLRRYNVANGLAHDQITSLLQDSRGYLWIGTFEGVSRFDGYSFVSYDTTHGLGTYVINDLAEDVAGRVWVATNGSGIARLEDAPGAHKPFTTFLPGPGAAVNVNVVAVDHLGRLWCGTDSGIYIADVSGATPSFSYAGFGERAASVATVQRDRVWIGVDGVGLVEFRGGQSIVHRVPWTEPQRFRRLLADRDDAVYVAADAGLFRFRQGTWERIAAGLEPQQIVVDLIDDGEGGIWLATNEGLVHYVRGRTLRYSLAGGDGEQLSSILADRRGNLWVGLTRAGLGRIGPEQIFSYRVSDGLPESDITALVEDPRGNVHAITRRGLIATVAGDRVSASGVRFAVGNRPLAAAHDGWFAVGDGIYHVPGSVPQFERATRILPNLTPTVPLPSSMPFAQVDAQGRLWFATSEPALYCVGQPLSAAPQVERWPLTLPYPTSLALMGIDRTGGVWLANMTMLARFRNGQLTVIPTPDGLANLQPRTLMIDRRGNVWIGLRFGGAMTASEPAAEQPRFVRYSMADGLASDTVWAMAEDRHGFIYFGTGRGLDQLNPETGGVRHFSTENGLAGNVITHLIVDRSGTLWAASAGGVSRFDLAFAPSHHAPLPVYISRVMLAGVEQALPERGATRVGELQLAASERNLRIDFVSPGSPHSGRLRYQYMLDQVDSTWSPPAFERTINYATLAPGRYRFRVRAVGEDGRTSEEPAVVEFVIHPPFWSSAWFMATAFAGLLAAAISAQQLRQQRRRSMAAVRRQVATDLHDDVGSGLSQIAILTELAKRKAESKAQPELTSVADLARSLRDSMSDIVWAVDPDRDVPSALVERMRQVTFNLLSSATEVTFHAPDERELARMKVAPDRRRHLLLIFKEAITNIARHAGATAVSIRLAVEGTRLLLTIRDNGVGFDSSRRYEGHGLDNLVTRSRSIGAEIGVRSAAGKGTEITITMPLRRDARIFRWLPTGERRG